MGFFFSLFLVSEIKIKKLCWRQSEREREGGGDTKPEHLCPKMEGFFFLKIRRAASENWHVPRQLERESKIKREREMKIDKDDLHNCVIRIWQEKCVNHVNILSE